MSLYIRIVSVCSIAAAIVLHVPALAQSLASKLSPTERPVVDVTKQPSPKAASYGLCSAPQNADDFPSSPVAIESEPCYNVQKFSATSNTPSTGGSCGGFTVAFGPLGDLKPNFHRVTLAAEWGDVGLTAANCASARLASVGWGARCSDDACTSAQWEKIGGPQQRAGTWNTTKKACSLSIAFASIDKKFKTLNLDIITTVVENGKTVRKRAKGTISARLGNGKCASTTAKPGG